MRYASTMKRHSNNSIDVPIGGLVKLSLVDYPGHTAAALFTIGCNMRCGYCHNPELVLPEQLVDPLPVGDILDWLDTRRGKLEGVAISGGEPTMHADLPRLIGEIKARGFLVKLDSNGTHPDMLAQLITDSLVDFIAMDIKGPLARYHEIAARPIDIAAIQRSVDIIRSSGIGSEFRTTIVKSQLSPNDIEQIGQLVAGAPRFALQAFRPGITISPQFSRETSYSEDEMKQLQTIMERYVGQCVIH